MKQTCEGERDGSSHAIGDASTPHLHLAVAAEHIGILLRDVAQMLHKQLGLCRIVFLSEALSPQRPIHLECPHAVIVEKRSIVIPSVTHIGIEVGMQQLFHILHIDLIALLVQEAEQALVEEAPVHVDRFSLGIGLEHGSKTVAGLLRQRIPEHLGCHE